MAAIDVTIPNRPTVEITHPSVVIGGLVTEQINGVTIGTAASGTTNNQVIQNSGGTSVGTESNPSVIGDATVTINSTSLGSTGSIVAEGSVDLVVNLDGTPSGNWDGNSWEVTSAACADATVQLNGVDMTDIPSGDTENILVLQSSGMTQVGSKQGVHWRVGDATVENSDSSYSTTVEAEGSLVIPNTPISANGDLVINQPSTIAKDVVVRYETQGVVSTTIVSGEVVVPDSFAPDPNRNPFTGNYSALAGSFGTGFQADGYGCFNNLYRWTTEPATSQDCEVEYYCGTLYGNQTFIGFSEILTSLPVLGNGFTGIRNNGASLGYFYANDVYVGTFYNPSTVDDVIKITWNATDGKFRLYVAGVLTYTSTYTRFGSVYPLAGANSGFSPVAGCFVTRLD